MKRKNKKSFNWYGLRQRFSIRKYHFGAASVLIGTTMFLMGGPTAQASEQNGAHVEATTSLDKPTAAAGSTSVTSNGVASQPKDTVEKVVEKTEDNKKTPVSKDELRSSLQELKSLLAELSTVDKDKVENQERVAEKAEQLLDSQEVSQEEVNTQVEFVRTSIQSWKKMKEEKSKTDKEKADTDKNDVSEKSDVENEKENKELKEDVTKKAVSDDNATLQPKSSENKELSTGEEKLAKLSESLEQYLRLANGITRPETKEMLKGVEEVVRSVEDGLKNPKLTASEIEELMKKGKQAEKKLALAVTREHSGKRDSDNGKRMSPDSYFRAANYYRAADGVVYDAKGNENLREAEVGYITKEGDGSGYLPGTVLYISHNDNQNANGTNNKDLGRQPVKYLKNKVRAEVTKSGNGYHWKITYNEGKEPRQNPIYYFTVPAGQTVTNMKLIENGVVKKQGGVAQVFNGAGDKYLTAVGSPVDGVHGSSYYDNVANMNNAIVGNRGSIYSLDDFVKNSTDPYFNRDGMSQEDIRIMDKLFEKIKSSTQNVFAFKPKDFDIGNTYTVEFDTVGNTEDPLYYIAGMKSYEKAGKGRFMHKSYQQWNRVQERYNITVDTSRAKTTFLKGTGIGDFDDSTALRNGAVTIEDTYDNNRKIIPSGNDIRDYKTYKPVGNESSFDHAIKDRHNAYTYTDPHPEWRSTTEDSTKGNHTTYIEAVIKGQKINFRLPFRVVSQSDVYQPVAKTVQDTKSYSGTLGDAANYIERYDDVSSKIPNFRKPTAEDMTSRLVYFGKFFKDRIEDFPTSSARIKEQAVKSVEWAGGTNDLTTGTRVIELTVNGKKELFTVPSDIDVAPGRPISEENVKKINDAIHEAYKKIDTNGHEVDAGKVPTVSSTTAVWVKKQIKVTYYDNENNERTNHQDDSVDYVDVLFKNIRKEATPTAPAISVPEDGSASVTPKGTTDKLVVSYRPTDQNADTTITVKKSGTTWGTLDTLPNGVTVNPSNGVVSITEPTVKDLSTITAKATYLNSDEASATDTVKTPDNVPPTVSFNGKALTENADDNRFIIYRGANFNPTFTVHDNKSDVNLSITGLPKGVGDLSTRGGKDFNYTIPDNNVATDAPFGEGTATVVATDSRKNTATYKFKYRVVELQSSNSPAAPEVGDSLGDAHRYLKVAESNTRDTDDYYPSGMKFIWKEVNPKTITVSEVSNDSKLNKIGKQTQYYATAVFPNSGVNDKNIRINNESASYKIYSGPTVSKPVEFNVRPKKPTLAAEQFYGTASTRPTVTVSNLPTNDQLQTGAEVKVELYQGTTKIASKTVTDRNGTTTLSAGDFTANLTEGQQVHAVVKVTGGQGATAYDVSSADSDNRIVTGRSRLNNLATEKLIVQVQDLNRNGVLSEAEKSAIKTAIFEANKNGVLKGKSIADINISATGLITAIDKDNKVAELQIDPKTGVVTRFAHIRDDYDISFNGKLRPTDPGFEWSPDGKSLIYKFDATAGSRDTIINTREILKKITATPKTNKAVGQPSLAVVTGNDKFYGENNQNNYSRDGSTGYFYHNNNGVNMLDIVGPSRYEGNVQVGNTANKLVEVGRGDINNGNIVGTTLGSDTISAENGAKAIPFNNVVKKVNGESLIVKQQLYLMPKYTNDQLLQDRGTTNADNTNVINVYFVPVDPTKPVVARSTSNTLATTSAQANRLADNTSFVSLAKLTDNYDKDDVTNSSSNTVRSKLNMWVKKGSTKVQIVENGVEKTDVINSLKKEVNSATYEVFAKTTDASGNKSHEDNSDGESLGFFRVGYNLVARQTINVVRGETLTQAELNKLVQVQEGNTLQDLPQGATVTAKLDTNSIRNGKEETKSVEATINFGENRTQKINLTYKVLNTFPIARTIYDFKNPDTARQGGSSAYYHNGGTIPDGMTWIYKGNDKVTKPGDEFTEALAKDPVGTTTNYEFGGKYNYGRFTNSPTNTGNLEYTERVVHKVFDITDSNGVTVNKGAALTTDQAKAAVKKADGSETLPEGTTYEWVENTDTSIPGVRTYKVKVTLPPSQSGTDQPNVTQKRPSKTIEVTVNVKPTAPTVTPATNGDVTVTPANETTVDKLEVTYTPADTNRLEDSGNITKTTHEATKIVAIKGDNNKWTITEGDKVGVTINGDTGAITLKDHIVKDKTGVNSTNAAQGVSSNATEKNTTIGDQEKPTIGLGNTLVGVGKEINLSLGLSDDGVGVDDSNIKVTLPTGATGLTYDPATKSIKGTLSSVTKNDIRVRVLDKNGNKAEKTISIAAVKAKPIYAIKDDAIPNVDTASNFVEMPTGVTLTSASWKNGQPTTTTVGNFTKTVTVNVTGYTATEVDVPVTVYPKVTYRKVDGKEVNTYHEIVDKALTSAIWGTKGRTTTVKPDFYVEFEGGNKPDDTTITFKNGNPASPSTTAGTTTKTIVVTYPNGAGTVEKTVTFKTYGNEAKYETGKNTIETTVGEEFSKITASGSIKLSDPKLPNPDKTIIGWWRNNDNYTPENKIGKRNENVNVYYGEDVRKARGDDTYNYNDQNISVNVTVKPQAPTIEENALRGKGTSKPNVTVGNLPTNNQLETGATVTVELYSGDKKVASKTVNGGTTSVEFSKNDYTDNLTYSEKVHAVVKVAGGSGNTAYDLSSANSNDVQVTPQTPTFDTATVTSTSRTLSGTLGGFDATNRVVELHLNDENNTVLSSARTGEITINGDKWTATLPDTVKLRQSIAKNGETTKPSGITVENKVAGMAISTISDEKEVVMGTYSVTPTIAGSKHIDITVPHDAKRVELRFHNSTETGDKPNSITLVRGTDGTWHTEATRADNTTVTDANGYVGTITSQVNPANKAENIVTIPLNEQNGANKLHLKEEEANGDNTATYRNGLGLRVDYQPEAGQDPTAVGNWKVVSVTNTAPAIKVKDDAGKDTTHRKVYDSGTTLTADVLKDLVTVTDAEDGNATESEKPYGTGNVKVVSGLPATIGTTPAGVYEVTLTAVDSQGKEGNQVKVYVAVKEAKPTAPTVGQWQNGNLKVTPATTNSGDKITIPLKSGNVVVTKDAQNGWQVTGQPTGVTFHNGSIEIPRNLVNTTVTATASKGEGEIKVISDEGTHTLTTHEVTKVDIIKKPKESLSGADLYSATGITGVVENGVTKTYQNAGIKSVTSVGTLPTLTPDSETEVPVLITYNDGSQENTNVTLKVAPAAPKVTVNVQDGATGDVTLTIKRHNDTNYPDNSVVTVPGIDGTFKVKDGTITIKNEQLKDKVQTGKVAVTEDTKLPAETAEDKEIPAKLKEAQAPTVTITQDKTTGEVTVTVRKPNGEAYANDTKVTVPGISGESFTVDQNGSFKIDNGKLPDEATSGKVKVNEPGVKPAETAEITIPGKLTSAKGAPAIEFRVKLPLPLVVPDPEHLTPTEIAELVKRVKEANNDEDNPDKEVTVDDKGNVTVTDKNTGESALLPVEDLTVKDFTPVKPTEKVPAKDILHLTPEEKKQMEEKVKAKNPGKEVTVGEDGTAIVTDPNTGVSHEIPGKDLVVQDFTPVKPTEKVPVKDKAHLTPEEKKQVEDKVKAKNPGKEVTVGEDGTATVKDPTTGVSHIIPGSDLTIAVGNDTTENNRPEDTRPDQLPATPEVPDNNGQDTPAVTPSNDDAANNSEAITPSDDVADTENTQVRPHRSQAILPNTGTAESAGFLSAAASMLAGLGFLIPFGKRRKKEEEESQND